jgi:hypothetical protein
MNDAAPAKKLAPKGDTVVRMTDAINQHADLLNVGQFQKRTMAELANEDATLTEGRSFYVPDESAGPCLVVSNGTNWRKITLGGIATP